MPDGLWLALGAAAGLAGVIVSVITLLRTRRLDRSGIRQEEVRRAVEDGNKPALERITRLEHQVALNTDKIASLAGDDARITGLMNERGARLAVMEAKIDVFWRSVALDAAKVLHSPHPGRKHMDELLEAFMTGVITSAQQQELQGILEKIRDNSPSSPPGFPVNPGEQIAAVILLRSLEYANQ